MRLVALLSVLNAATQPKRNEIEFRFDADDQWLETATLLGAVGACLRTVALTFELCKKAVFARVRGVAG